MTTDSFGLGHAESAWLTDCLYYYKSIESLKMLHDVRERMVTEGPRLWRKPENGNLVCVSMDATSVLGPGNLGSQRTMKVVLRNL